MSLGDYLLGIGIFAAIAGGSLITAAIVVRRRLGYLEGASPAVAFSIVATAVLIAIQLVPGALGILNRGSVAVCALLAPLAAHVATAARHASSEGREAELSTSLRGREIVPIAVAAVAVLGVAAVIAAFLRDAVAVPTTGVDTLNFYLPLTGRWIQEGSLWGVHQFVPELAQGNYPSNGSLTTLAFVLPWHNDAFVRFSELPWVVIAGLAVYATAVELRAPAPTAASLAALFAATPTLLVTSLSEVLPDPVLVAMFAAGALFMVRHIRTGRMAELLLAGVALGIAFGTKWYGTVSVVLLIAVWATAMLLWRRGWSRIARDGATLGALILGAGGFWLLRNLIETDNPVFPLKVAPLGVTIFDAPPDTLRERAGFTISDYAFDLPVWREHLLPALVTTLGLVVFLIPLAGLIWVVVALRERAAGGRKVDPRLAFLAAATVVLGVAYAFTPDTALGPEGEPVLAGANTRYALPALVLAFATVAACATAMGPRARLALQLAALALTADAIRRGLDVGIVHIAAASGLIALAAALAYAAWGSRWPALGRWRLASAGAAVIAVAVIGLGYEAQKRFNGDRYETSDPVLTAVVRTASSDHRIGVTGTWSNDGVSPVLPSFGPRFGNQVFYVGPTVRGMLREFRRCDSFRSALTNGNYDLLVIGKGAPVPQRRVREQRCAEAAGWHQAVGSRRLALYLRRGSANQRTRARYRRLPQSSAARLTASAGTAATASFSPSRRSNANPALLTALR